MRTRPLLIALIAAGVSVTAFSTRAAADVGAGVIFGGAIGAMVGGPPGWVAGMAIGAAIGESEEQKNARVHGNTRYVVAPPPPGFNGVPPDYVERRVVYSRPTVVYSQPAYYAPPAAYPAPVYYGPRHYYRPYY